APGGGGRRPRRALGLAPSPRHESQGFESEATAEILRRPWADEDRSGLCLGLQAGGDVHRVAEGDRPTVPRADEADGDLTAVDAHADVEVRQRPRRADLFRVLADRIDDPQGGPGSTLRIVLARGREAEERGDAVAHVGVDPAPELLDDSAHAADAFTHDLRHLFGPEALADCRRADDVGEERRDGTQLILVRLQDMIRLAGSVVRRRRRRRLLERRRGLDGGFGRATRGTDDLEMRLAELDDVSGRERDGRVDSDAVDPSAVQRAEVLDFERAASASEDGVTPRHLRILDDDVRTLRSAEDDRADDRNRLPRAHPVHDRELWRD